MSIVRLHDIMDSVRAYAPDAHLDVVMRAYVFSARAHAGQTRKSGEPYLVHPLAVAAYLAEMKMDVETIATALLHDTVEDTLVTREELARLFGEEIADLVDGVTKIGKLRFKSKAEAQAENFRKMVLAMSRDIRVVLVKLADRLHNMHTLQHMRPDKQRRIAQETIEIYAPIAKRLGLGKLTEELQDLCFRYIHPETYRELSEAVTRDKLERDNYIARNTTYLEKQLALKGVKCDVRGRAKSLYSIHRKMMEQSLEFDQVHDILAFRMFVDTISQCYETLGHVHGLFCPVPGKIKDYIAMPKTNGYQSLHTTIIGPEGQRIEVQIRTWDMHRMAEHGIASHWRYKEGHLALKQKDISLITQLREIFETAREVEDPSEFIETVKVDLFTQEVYVFTPAREVKVLPFGATALDFAYAIHTEVGHHCIGAKANGKMVPIRYELKSGDTIEILTRSDQKPNRDWLRIAHTGRALTKIRRALRNEELERGRALGREMLEGELRKHGVNLNRLIKDGKLDNILEKNSFKDQDQLFLALARGHKSLARIAREVHPEGNWGDDSEKPTSGLSNLLDKIRRRSASPVLISGEEDILVNRAKCCNPLPGEPVAGFITHGHGISIHSSNCSQLLSMDKDRRIPVEWDARIRTLHAAVLNVVCADRPGLLASISKVCEEAKLNISRVDAHPVGNEKSLVSLVVEVHDVRELTQLGRKLERVKGIVSVARVRQ